MCINVNECFLRMKNRLTIALLQFTEPWKLYFYDVRESFFDAYRTVMNPFYKDLNGKLCTYTTMKKHAVYHEPFYSQHDKKSIGEEARKFLMPSDKMWQKASKILNNIGRSPVQVKLILYK